MPKPKLKTYAVLVPFYQGVTDSGGPSLFMVRCRHRPMINEVMDAIDLLPEEVKHMLILEVTHKKPVLIP
jgi:hypothetical protein